MLSLFALNMGFGLNCICFSDHKAGGGHESLSSLIANQESCLLRKERLLGVEVMTDGTDKASVPFKYLWTSVSRFAFLLIKTPRHGP